MHILAIHALIFLRVIWMPEGAQLLDVLHTIPLSAEGHEEVHV